jgi:hypothetical protein
MADEITLPPPYCGTQEKELSSPHVVAGLVGFSIVLCGFAPSYYLRHWLRTTPLPGLLQLHGALMTSWFVLFFVQVSLIARHRLAVHRRLGIAGATLAGFIVVVWTITALRFLRNNLHAAPGFGPPAPEFFGFLLFDLYVFGGLVASAILLRKNSEAHRRLMLLATLSMISPGVVRIPFEQLSPGLAFPHLTPSGASSAQEVLPGMHREPPTGPHFLQFLGKMSLNFSRTPANISLYATR